MGLFDLLFSSRQKRDVGRRTEEEAHGDGEIPDPTIFLVPRERAPIVPLFPRPAVSEPARRGADESGASKPLVVTLGDVIARIPPELLQEGAAGLRCELRFGPGEFFSDIPRGRVTVALSNIAAQCPEAFRVPITDDTDREVRLPLQKVIDQLLGSPLERSTGGPPVLAPAPAPVNLPAPAPENPIAEPTIRLSLAAILAECPDAVFAGPRPSVEDAVQVALPFAPIEEQLPGGVVEISAERFLALLPPSLAGQVSLRAGAKLPLPIQEIFRNLPGGRAFPMPPTPHPHMTPPPPLLVSPLGESGPTDPHSASAAEPSASSIAVPAGTASPGLTFARPAIARPFVVLPPPLAVAAPEHAPETTADQTAVLEFLARRDGAES